MPFDPIPQKIVWQYVERVKAAAPVVHNITNYVAMQTVANSLLAFGASPIMAHAQEEMEDITRIASALVVNIGTLSLAWIDSMAAAIKAANARNIPVVIDPVGAGASSLRTKTSLMLMDQADCLLVRGNPSEIMALAGVAGASKGVDSVAASEQAWEAADTLARCYHCTVCASGAVDIISNGTKHVSLYGGSALMPRVTALGCTASAMVGAFAGVLLAKGAGVRAAFACAAETKSPCTTKNFVPDTIPQEAIVPNIASSDTAIPDAATPDAGRSEEIGRRATAVPGVASKTTGAGIARKTGNTDMAVDAVAAAMAVMSAAGAKAEQKAYGPGSFLPEFLDALYLLAPEDLEKKIRISSGT